MYSIEIKSQFEELYRYNIIVSCAGYNAAAEQIYVVGCEKIFDEHINEGIVPLPPRPEDFTIGEVIRLESQEAESIYVIVYVITNTLPEDRIIEHSPPFEVSVSIARDSEKIYDAQHKVNQWGGATINIKL